LPSWFTNLEILVMLIESKALLLMHWENIG